MRVSELIGGMQFKSVIPDVPGTVTFIAYAPHPIYQGLALVIWRIPNGQVMFDALDWHQVLPAQVEPFTPEMLIGNVRIALNPDAHR